MSFVAFKRLSGFCSLMLVLVVFTGCQEQSEENPSASNETHHVEERSFDSEVEQFETRTEMASEEEVISNDATETHSDDEYRAIVVGTWEDDYQGHRTLTVRKDGTATMVVELEGVAATLYAAQMTFDEEWSIIDGRLKLKTLGGEPEGRVNLILSTMGDLTEQEILELTPERMLLLDADGKTKYDWRRVPDDNSPAEPERQGQQSR